LPKAAPGILLNALFGLVAGCVEVMAMSHLLGQNPARDPSSSYPADRLDALIHDL
jgi:hypothetical protein